MSIERLANGRIRIRRARITDIQFYREYGYVTIAYSDDDDNRDQNLRKRITLFVTDDTNILDDNRDKIGVRDLREGMRVNAVVSSDFVGNNPPLTYAYRIVVREQKGKIYTTDGVVLSVDNRDDELLIVTFQENGRYSIIALKIDDQTEIYNRRNQKIELRNLRRGMQVVVEHSEPDTKEFPPTAVAFKITRK